MDGFDQLLGSLGRLAVAFALALPVGWEREQSARSAGLRTFPLAAIAVCGFLLAGRQAFASDVAQQSNVVAALLAGIGVIGGGAILRGRGRVRGMASAAGLWVTAGIGAAAAYGLFGLAAAMSLLTFGALRLRRCAGDGARAEAEAT